MICLLCDNAYSSGMILHGVCVWCRIQCAVDDDDMPRAHALCEDYGIDTAYLSLAHVQRGIDACRARLTVERYYPEYAVVVDALTSAA